MPATSTLSQEQKHVLATTFHFVERAQIYLKSVLPVVSGPDEQLLQGLLELGEMCLRLLPMYFPELQPLADEREKRGGGQ